LFTFYFSNYREGVESFFEDLNIANIPVLIISAGLGNIILEVLSKHSLLKNNLKVIANHVKYYQIDDEITDAVSSRQFVHPYNKDIISSRLSDSYFENLSHCKNMILLGDSLGDLHMSCGAAANTLLTIGFLNEKVDNTVIYIFRNKSYIIVALIHPRLNSPWRTTRNILTSF
jgi:5'-nucleotidase